ncbi:MAG: protein PhnA [Parvicella sp.]|jgi:protein PhnA
MSVEKALIERSDSSCEICVSKEDLKVYAVPPQSGDLSADNSAYLCATCITQIENPDQMEPNHWRCLKDSMWSEQNAVKVVAWRMLSRLKAEVWPVDLLDMMYLEADVLSWAEATGEGIAEEDRIIHRDSNGVILKSGDSVTLIKDLPVKGSSMIAKRGTAVRNITLDMDNANYIEGKVNTQRIVIITDYVKKNG